MQGTFVRQNTQLDSYFRFLFVLEYFPQKQTVAFASLVFEAILFNLYHPMFLFNLSDIAFRSRKANPYGAKRLDKEHTNDLPPQNLPEILGENESSLSARKRTQFRWDNLLNYPSLSFIPSGKNPRDSHDQRFRRRIFHLNVCFLISFISVWGDNFSLGLQLIFNQFYR